MSRGRQPRIPDPLTTEQRQSAHEHADWTARERPTAMEVQQVNYITGTTQHAYSRQHPHGDLAPTAAEALLARIEALERQVAALHAQTVGYRWGQGQQPADNWTQGERT